MKAALSIVLSAAMVAAAAHAETKLVYADAGPPNNVTGWKVKNTTDSCVKMSEIKDWSDAQCITVSDAELGELRGMWRGALSEGSKLRLPSSNSSSTAISVLYNSTSDYWDIDGKVLSAVSARQVYDKSPKSCYISFCPSDDSKSGMYAKYNGGT